MMQEQTIIIVMEQYMSEDPNILGVFSTQELADMFIYDNERPRGQALMRSEEWVVDGTSER